MKRKILTFLVLVLTVIGFSALNVWAEKGYIDDFSVAPQDGMVKNYPNWAPYEDAGEAGVTWEDESIKVEKNESTKPVWVISTEVSEEECFFMFDMKQNNFAAGNNFSGYFYTSGGRSIFYICNPEPDVWYTYIFASRYEIVDGEEKLCMSIFRCLTGSDEWSKVGGPTPMDAKSAGTKFNINFRSANNGAITWFDNIKAHGGLYYDSITATDGKGNEVDLKNDIPEYTEELNITANIYNANSISSTMLTEPKKIPVLAMVTVFNKKGMMLDCATVRTELDYFENNVTVNIPLGEYDRVDIENMKLYVLDSIDQMRNIMQPEELK